MAEAAWLELPYPEAAVVDEDSLAEQTLALAADLPDRPLVLGGCCCAHVGAVEGLAQGEDTLGVVWIDAHGDLNTPASSPSGNAWGMPLRMLIDDGAVDAGNVALVGARALDPPEVEFIERAACTPATGPSSVRSPGRTPSTSRSTATRSSPGSSTVFFPEPGGLGLDELEALLREVASRRRVAGAGLTGLVGAPENEAKLARLCAALGL